MIPRSPGVDEDVHLDLNTWIAIDATKRHAVHLIAGSATQRASAGPTEAQAPSGSRLIEAEILLAVDPGE